MFTRGFAYEPGHKYDTGLLFGKRAMVSVTTGTFEDTYAPNGIDGALLDVLWPAHNVVVTPVPSGRSRWRGLLARGVSRSPGTRVDHISLKRRGLS